MWRGRAHDFYQAIRLALPNTTALFIGSFLQSMLYHFQTKKHCKWRLEWYRPTKMADISLDTIKDFFSLKPLKTNAFTDVKITGRHWDQGQNSVQRQQFKLPKKNPQR